ncbi:MAG: hypothetical protein ACRD1E_09665 [Terriglobales bacterium]
MSFGPSLSRLLRLRRSLERQEELKLAMASGRMHAARAGLEQAQDAGRRQQQAVRAELSGQLSGAELQSADWQRGVASARERRLAGELEAAQAAQADQRRTLLERTRERKTLDTLQAHSREADLKQELRREQAELDEAFLRALISDRTRD